jgi:DNA-binding transcriptional ArsR family regulator
LRDLKKKEWAMSLPQLTPDMTDEAIEQVLSSAKSATDFMKALAHEGRLMILCHLVTGEKSVTELENLLSSRQAAVSQQLARLRLEGLVNSRRDGKTIYYSLGDPKAAQMIELVYDMFCKFDPEEEKTN